MPKPNPALSDIFNGPASANIDSQNKFLSSGTEGLGPDSGKPIATFPAVKDSNQNLVISSRTGEPLRSPMVYLAVVLFYLSSALAGGAGVLAWFRMIQISGFRQATRLASWFSFEPYQWQSIALACLITAMIVLVAAGPAVAGYNTWCGRRWSRWVALVGLIIGFGLGYLLTRWIMLAMIPGVAGAVLLWLPQLGWFFTQFEIFRFEHRPKVVTQNNVFYGPLPNYR